MKLYLYEHCPYCVRVEMVAHYRHVPVEKVWLANDDEASCRRLIGSKQVPILEFDDGRAMAESLDIAQVLDQLGSAHHEMREETDFSLRCRTLLDQVQLAICCLLFPRDIAIGCPEFATEAAREYFRSRKEVLIGRSFARALAESSEHIRQVEQVLARMPVPPLPGEQGNTLGWDDVMIFPTLRNLGMVRGLQFPPALRRYVDEVTRLSGVPSYFERAC